MCLLHCSAIFCYYSANISAVLLQRWVPICACTNVKRAEDALKVELQVIVSCHKGAGTKTRDLGRSRKRSVSEPSLSTSIVAYHNAAVCFELYKISVLVTYVFIHQSLWSDQHTTMYTYMCSHSACLWAWLFGALWMRSASTQREMLLVYVSQQLWRDDCLPMEYL